MKRVVACAVGVLAMVGLSACQGPPEGYRPPSIDSVTQVSPQPAHPGEDVTFEIVATDDAVLSHAVALSLVTPSGSTLPGPRTCTTSLELIGALNHGVVTVVCPVPAFASNGIWSTDVTVYDRPPNSSVEQAFPGTKRRLSFEVAGGSEDRSGPRLISSSTDPAVVGQETGFTLTMRVRDDTGPVVMPNNGGNFVKLFAPNSFMACKDPVYTPVSATDTDIVLSCAPGMNGRTEVGQHQSGMLVADALGQVGQAWMYLDVQPQAPGGTP